MTTDSKSAPAPDHDIARLLREAGPRPGVDRERTERVRAAVHTQWVETTRARKRKVNTYRIVGVLAAAASLVVMLLPFAREDVPQSPAPIVPVGMVETLTGSLRTSESVLTLGDTVLVGARLQTGANARAGVRLASGPSLRLDVTTLVVVDSPGTFTLESGAVYVDSGVKDGTLEIRTPLGVARDVGTQFEVRLRDGAMMVRVREGLVELTHESGVEDASAGDELRLSTDGQVELGRVLPYAPQWDWITRTAPPFTLEGRSLDAYLGWVSQEHGWTVRFEDRKLEEDAYTIMLEGPALSMTPGATLDTVLPACGLTHRIENGQLWIADSR